MLASFALLTILAGEVQSARLPIPPPMPRRSIAKWRDPWPGTTSEITVDGKVWTLFVPTAWKPGAAVDLTVHFHSAQWHAIQEHLDRGLSSPMLAFYPGEGSSIYASSVKDPGHFERLWTAVRDRLKTSDAKPDPALGAIDVTSFSAGYGAVREWVQQPSVFAKLRRVILADSMYASLDPSHAPERVVASEHVDVWVPLARAAMERKKEFVVTVSEVPTPTYASSLECATALVARVGGAFAPIEPGSLAATLDSEFPLRSRFDSGRFHVWAYGGSDGQAHMTHARRLADIWMALDAANRS